MKNEKGITILALIVTIIVMTIITFTVFYSAKGIDKSTEDDMLFMELKTVQHIVLQEYNKKLVLGDKYNYIGIPTTNISDYNQKLGNKLKENTIYYILGKDDLEKIGAKNVNSKYYLVCYETGEVANISEFETSDREKLHIEGTKPASY